MNVVEMAGYYLLWSRRSQESQLDVAVGEVPLRSSTSSRAGTVLTGGDVTVAGRALSGSDGMEGMARGSPIVLMFS